jgi:hypothetical protein
MRCPNSRGSGICACNATRSRAGRGSRLHKCATVELRPSAPTNIRARKKPPEAVSMFQWSFLFNPVTVVCSWTFAPSSRARLKSRSSKRLRFTEISPLAPDGRSTVTPRPLKEMNSTEDNFECGNSRTRSATSSRSKTGQHDGFKQSPHTFSRGNFSRSSTRGCKPAIAQNAAQLDPAGPPPTIATSNVSITYLILSCRAKSRNPVA